MDVCQWLQVSGNIHVCVRADDWDSSNSLVAWAHGGVQHSWPLKPPPPCKVILHMLSCGISTVRQHVESSAKRANGFKKIIMLDWLWVSTDKQLNPHYREILTTWEWRWRSMQGYDRGPHILSGNVGRGVGGGGRTRDDLWATDHGSCEVREGQNIWWLGRHNTRAILCTSIKSTAA